MDIRDYVLQDIQKEVFKRDGYKCRCCGRGVCEVNLETAFFEPYIYDSDLSFCTDDLFTICSDCKKHSNRVREKKGYMAKRSKDEEIKERIGNIDVLSNYSRELINIRNKEIEALNQLLAYYFSQKLTPYGEKRMRSLINKYDFETVYLSFQEALDYYFPSDDTSMINAAFNMLYRICATKQMERRNPYIKTINILVKGTEYMFPNQCNKPRLREFLICRFLPKDESAIRRIIHISPTWCDFVDNLANYYNADRQELL